MKQNILQVACIWLLIIGSACSENADNNNSSGDHNTTLGDSDAQSDTGGICGAQAGQLFGSDYPWNQAIDQEPLDSESATMITYLQTNHTSSMKFRIDGPSDQPNSTYGITMLYADDSTTDRVWDSDIYSPDCDTAAIPTPAAGAIEGEQGYACDGDGDCHLIVVDSSQCRLFEMWRADDGTNGIEGCLAVWDLEQSYNPELRGDCCTSADAAGLPIAAHMFGADDIAAGEINHAIRFILPNNLMRERIYVRPATHSTGATSGSASAPPYGARLRLRADYDVTTLNSAAQVVARALQKYGMILSDGGNITFTALNDRFTQNKWTDVGLMPQDLTSLQWNDFEVVELGTRYTWDSSCNCTRSIITQ